MTRRESRVIAMQILYAADLNNKKIYDVLDSYDAEQVTSDVREFVAQVADNLEKIDSIISNCLVNYTFDRLNTVDRAIVRLATAEMLSELDVKIAINEALEITREFSDVGDDKQVKFNNRLLDRVGKYIKGDK